MHCYDHRIQVLTNPPHSAARVLRVTLHMSQPNESRAVCRDFDKRKHYFSLHTSEQVVVHEIYGARIAVNTLLIKCETDKLSDKTR